MRKSPAKIVREYGPFPGVDKAGAAWIDGELSLGTWEGDESDLRRVDPRTGEVFERLEMPLGVHVSGLEFDGGDQFFCGGGNSAKVRAVFRLKRGSAVEPSK